MGPRLPPRRTILALLPVILLTVACADTAKRRFVDRVLDERAGHLNLPDRERIARAVMSAERRHDVDALLLLAVIEQESHFRIRARSGKGARGLMQVKPATAAAVAKRHDIPWRGADDLFDPETNIAVGVNLASLYLNTGRDEEAVPLLEHLIRIDPENENYRQLLQMIRRG